MTQQCTYEFIRELQELLNNVSEAFYYEDGRVIEEKDFGDLSERISEYKSKLSDILDSCAEGMYGKRVNTSMGLGKVTSYGLGGKSGKEEGVLVYNVLLDEGGEEYFWDYEMTVV